MAAASSSRQGSQASERPRAAVLWECDHMRLVARNHETGEWSHLMEDGFLGGPCSAGVYRVEAVVTGSHTVDRHSRALGR